MTISPLTTPNYGVDLITFFSPTFWGLSRDEEVAALAQSAPKRFWNTVLDALQKAEITEIEMTFSPADRESALAAYGSTGAFARELADRGMRVVSSYFSSIEDADDVAHPATREKILNEAEAEAAFLAELGATVLVTGLPMRRNNATGTGLDPVSLATVLPLVELVHEVGAITARHGVTVALHTESHSVFWTPRDIDLFLLLTDPFLVSFCPDTGHIVLGGGDPVAILHRHRERVVMAHWKDATGPFTEKVNVDAGIFARHRDYFRAAGQGVVDWCAFAQALAEAGYSGGIMIELDAAPDPVAELITARNFFEKTLAGIV
ncbi:sugar phosphate isomerase/epimerase [Lysinibacter sp. HNR]|uniref:sugar phosphate isomerase/epimerase family protein n=1 Tax=Lysinibacter sp. HNR TaxID=3031408 RepID=UPI002435FF40|nr:sugar phosphate isomerase/epimerase [Lysinibacter sp. HNR]WGD37225.1 sugar phosphate isomerase/epimerase [Lysinibacter sp. HNR]